MSTPKRERLKFHQGCAFATNEMINDACVAHEKSHAKWEWVDIEIDGLARKSFHSLLSGVTLVPFTHRKAEEL